MRIYLATFVAVVGVWMVAPEQAQAQSAPAVEASSASGSRLWIGGNLGLSPVGSLEGEAAGVMTSSDAATAFGLGGLIEYRVTPFVSIGFAPNLLFNVKGTDANDSASELDLPIRVTAGAEVAPKVRLYGFAAPGYSILFPPSTGTVDIGHPAGFMIGFGGGVGYQVAPKLMLTGELGYQFRFPSTTVQNVDISYHVNYLTFAFGVVAAID